MAPIFVGFLLSGCSEYSWQKEHDEIYTVPSHHEYTFSGPAAFAVGEGFVPDFLEYPYGMHIGIDIESAVLGEKILALRTPEKPDLGGWAEKLTKPRKAVFTF